MSREVPSIEVFRPVKNINAGHIERLHDALYSKIGEFAAASFIPSDFKNGAKVFHVLGGSLVAFHRRHGITFGSEEASALGEFLDNYDFPPSMDKNLQIQSLPMTPYRARGAKAERIVVTVGEAAPIVREQVLVRAAIHKFHSLALSAPRIPPGWPRNTERFTRLDIGTVGVRHAPKVLGGLHEVFETGDVILPHTLIYGGKVVAYRSVIDRSIHPSANRSAD